MIIRPDAKVAGQKRAKGPAFKSEDQKPFMRLKMPAMMPNLAA